ncbi:CHRD domain-containing protein [Membranihabitans marinus]|uniref:CHRD domain-containing protein n=1 Tax=Membranihabitans marinus TaxID=1227546 RepID=UPI001F19E0B2|nr:CHRD domain-containing protein [Membranihabitans marinus]
MYQKFFTSLLCLFLGFYAGGQISSSSISNFQDNNDGWDEASPSPNKPTLIATGGPAGDSDGFLRNESTGSSGAGGKWVLMNSSSPWIGNYTTAGITKISMDVRNAGSADVHLRMSFASGNNQLSSNAVVVAPSADWSTIEIDISTDQLTVVEGNSTAADIMANVTTARIINNANADWRGSQTAAIIEIDNIKALTETADVDYSHEAYLSGLHQLVPVQSLASGKIEAVLSGDTLKVSGSFTGISSQVDTTIGGGLHIHSGIIGINGGVIFPLKAEFSDDLTSGSLTMEDNSFVLSSDQMEMLDQHLLYVNIHSKDHPSGEIRGQITPKSLYTFSTNLFGGYQNPSVMTNGRGSIILTISQDSMMTLSGTFSGLQSEFNAAIGGGAHIHNGMVGSNGGVMQAISATLDPSGLLGNFFTEDHEIPVSEDFIDALLNRELYINIHTVNAPSGEIRGQLIPASSKMVFRSHLSGNNEVHLPETLASGLVMAEIMASDSVALYGSYNSMVGTLATQIAGGIHIHKGMAGQNGDVILPLTNTILENNSGTIPFADNVFETNDTLLTDIMNRSVYVNIHSSSYPSGEIRGQLVGDAQAHFSAFLTSSQELSNAVSEGWGGLKAELLNNVLTVSGSFENLSADLATQIRGGAHLHIAPPGSNGGIAFDLNLDVADDLRSAVIWPDSNRFTLSGEQVLELQKRNFYINVHSSQYTGGELRGQLLFDPNLVVVSLLGGSQENPPVDSPAKGLLMGEVDNSTAKIFGSFQGLTTPLNVASLGGAHIHGQMAGKNGTILSPIVFVTDSTNLNGVANVASNIIPIPSTVVLAILSRQLYINVHSEQYGGGEIRGQILPLAQNYFMANLLGTNASPMNTSEGNGLILFEYHQGLIQGAGSFDGLEGPVATTIRGGAHIHNAYVGSNGGILEDLTISLDTDSTGGVFFVEDNTILLDEEQRQDFLAGGKYVNIHSATYGGGEIRGQILPVNNYFPDADTTQLIDNQVVVIDTTDGEAPVDFEWYAGIDNNPLAYKWQWSVDASFDSLLFESSLINDNMTSVTSSNLMDTLTSFGYFANADTACLYQRFWVTDGSLSGFGPVEEICFVHGIRTSLKSDPLLSVTKVGPIPARDELLLTIQNYQEYAKRSTIQLQIFNAQGRMVKDKRIQLLSPDYRETIELYDLNPGTYFLKLNNAIWPFVKM